MKSVYIVLLQLVLISGLLSAQDNLPTYDEVPVTVKNFLDNSQQSPFGKKNKLAPDEIEHIGKLAGIWYCDTFNKKGDEWVKGKPAFWAFKYILDGFAIEDLWFKKLEDLPEPAQAMGHDFSGINIRLYDPYENKWKAKWFTNSVKVDTTNQLVANYDAVSTDETFVMTRADFTGAKRAKITFYNMTDKSFDWVNELSSDSGKTWKSVFKIKGRKIK